METVEITNATFILKMIETVYRQFPIYSISAGKPKHIKIVEVNHKGVFIQAPGENHKSLERSLFLINEGSLHHFIFKIIGVDAYKIELLYPVSLSISKATRATERYPVATAPLFISNIINQTMIPQDLSNDSMKVESIINPFVQQLKSLFSEVIIFIHERMDGRIKIMADSGKSIFIPDCKSPDSVPDSFIPYNKYIHLMKLGMREFQSEICVPLTYKNIFLFGYLQVLNSKRMEMKDYDLIQSIANIISKEIAVSGIFNDSKFIASIMDISSIGLSFPHPQSRHFGKIFSIGGTILFELFEENQSLGTFRAIVRDITPLEKMFRIGCQFFQISEEDKILSQLIKKYFPSIQKEEELKKIEMEKNLKDKSPTKKKGRKADDILNSLLDEDKQEANITNTIES
jgi:hypothetical protein